MARDVLYLGDGSLTSAARYLAGALYRLGWSYDHVSSADKPGALLRTATHRLFILSDYPASNLTSAQMARIVAAVEAGAGLLMIGGWASFQGPSGGYRGTPIAGILPVRLASRDDRRQGAAGYRIVPAADASTLGLDVTSAPIVSGYNQTSLRHGATEMLSVQTLAFTARGAAFTVLRTDPLLSIRTYGEGVTAALTTDLAPHWSGGLVDWGPRRVTLRAPGALATEVGESYLKFIEAIVRLVIGR